MPTLSDRMLLGPYTIVAPLGAGGMGEVYRAMDTRLKRQVAIKVLPSMLAADPERLGRFQREAEVLASVNHPHIAAIYGLEEANGVKALVMELVEGATVADRIGQGPMPIDEALPIARQIAEALEAAHERGIIHRDLKPANIKVRDDGKVKVLDFGLAKLTDASGASVAGGDSASQAATVMSPATMTGMGMILGTAAYMSPEQARGKTVDKRSDVWAFGAVLYEMLTAKRAFAGDDIAETIASVMKTTPDWTALPTDVPPHVVTLIQRCLDKDRTARISDIAVARFLLSEDASFSGISGVTSVPARTIARSSTATPALTSGALPAGATGRPWGLLLPVLIAAVVSGGAIGWLLPRRSTVAAPVTYLQMNLRPVDQLVESQGARRPARTAMALSPDGRLAVFAALKGETTQLYARALNRAEATAIAGTEGGEEPFFSPDGAWIGFRSANKIKKVPAAGGASAVVCDLSPGMRGPGGSWAEDDAIYFSGNEGIFKVSAAGGTPVRVAEPVRSKGERLLLPHVLPGANAILFTTVIGDLWDAARIVVQPLGVGTLADEPRRDLITGGADARYVDSGHLVYMKSGTLMAVPFDVASQQVIGAPVAQIENVMQAVNAPNFDDETGAGQFAVSKSGTLLYALGGIGPIRQSSLVWVDRTGAVTPLEAVAPAPQLQPRLSPDGQKLAVNVRRGASRVTDVWVFDVTRGAPTRLTLAMDSSGAVWSPDSKRVAFASSGGGVGNKVFVANADGSGQPERLTDIQGSQTASTWAASGNAIAFLNRAPGSPLSIWVLPMNGMPRTPRKFLEPGVYLSDPELSPDGKWMAYVSNESGQPEVYVQPYAGPGEKIRISTNVGYEPIWIRSGREILYRSSTREGERHFYSVAIHSLSPFRFDPPRLVFKAKAGEFDSTTPIRGWDATADGQRFLMNKPIPSTDKPAMEMHVVLNWTDELRRRVPTK
ncbi:MAG: protein kinase domain-containing protein [Vicinamibacterales bacterium]